MKSTKDKIFVIVILAAIVCCIKLGFWQINRMHWKSDLINKLEISKVAEPIDLDLKNFDADRDLFKKVKAKGEFINTQEIYLAGKYLTEERNKNQIGVHIITPFKLKSGEVVLVNRGWMPQDKKLRENHLEAIIDGEVELNAIVRENKGTPPSFMPTNMPAKNIWFWIDIPEMTRYLNKHGIQNVQPVLLQQTNLTVKSGEYPKLISTNFEFYNEHLTYVYTWFGTALALFIMLCIWIRKNKKKK